MRALGSSTWGQVGSFSGAVLAVPVGATEQHGPHLPLSTDTEIARALAARLAATEPDLVVAPALSYGASGEHADFPGTLSIGAAATELVLLELCRSAAATFQLVVLISTHGGNAGPLAAAVELLRSEGREVRAWTPSWGGDAHAGRTETSLMLAIAPGLVRLDRAAPGNPEPIAALLPRLRQNGVRDSASNGVLGNPAGASGAEGERLLATAVAELRELVVGVAA
jgi:mycofactocin system creatininase family protein